MKLKKNQKKKKMKILDYRIAFKLNKNQNHLRKIRKFKN